MKKYLIISLLAWSSLSHNLLANTKQVQAQAQAQYHSFVDRFRPVQGGTKALVRPTLSDAELFDDLVVDLAQEMAQLEQLHQTFFKQLSAQDQKVLGPKLQDFFRRYHRGELGKALDLLNGEPI